MTPKPTSVVLTLGLAAWVGGCGTSSHIAKEADRSIAHAQLASLLESMPDNPVHTIVMPHDEPVFPPGPGRDVFMTACVVCHSPRYITMQPPFSRTAWKGEINKMKEPTQEAPVSKDCPACAMTIPVKATRCPHCTTDLSRPAATQP